MAVTERQLNLKIYRKLAQFGVEIQNVPSNSRHGLTSCTQKKSTLLVQRLNALKNDKFTLVAHSSSSSSSTNFIATQVLNKTSVPLCVVTYKIR